MTHRANQSMTVAGILAVLISLFAYQLWREKPDGEPEQVDVEDDDSGDDDSATFDHLAPAPKE